MNKNNLKSCPFCGCDKENSLHFEEYWDLTNEQTASGVYCKKCGAINRRSRNNEFIVKKGNKRSE